MDDPQVPIAYVVSRELREDQAPYILSALGITPVVVAIFSDLRDAELAHTLCAEGMRSRDEEDSYRIAQKVWETTQRPALIIGKADTLDAIFLDGHKETVATSC